MTCSDDFSSGTRPHRDDILDAVGTVLGDESFRAAARRLQTECAEHDALRAIGELLAELGEPAASARLAAGRLRV